MTTQIAPGRYTAHATNFDFGQTSKGTDQIMVLFELDDGPFKGRVISWYGYLSDRAAPHTIRALRTMGWTGDDLYQLSSSDIEKQVSIVIEEEDYQGNKFTRVQWINPLDPGPVKLKSMDVDKKKAMAQRLRGLCMASREEGDRNVPPPPETDDIPF